MERYPLVDDIEPNGFINYHQALNSPVLFQKSTNSDQLKNYIFKSNSQKSLLLLLAYIFESYQNYSRLLPSLNSVSRPICSESLKINEQVYTCYDCFVNDRSVLCQQCFESEFKIGKHKGHKFKVSIIQNQGYYCDCGDASLIKPEGFCANHTGIANYGKQLDQRLLVRLRQGLKTVFDLFFQSIEAWMDICNLREVQNQFKPQKVFIKTKMKDLISILESFVTDFCQDKFSLQNQVFKIFLEPLNQSRYHNCCEKDPFKFWASTQNHLCYKSAYDLFYKYNLHYDNQLKKSISQIQLSFLAHHKTQLEMCRLFYENLDFSFLIVNKCQANVMFTSQLCQQMVYFHLPQQMQLILQDQTLEKLSQFISRIMKQTNMQYYYALFSIQKQSFTALNFIFIQINKNKQIDESQKLKLFKMLFSLSEALCSKHAYYFQHHHIKLYLNHNILNLGLHITKQLEFKSPNKKEVYQKIINDYLLEEQKQEEKELIQDQTIIVDWLSTNDLVIGTLLLKIYLKLGLQQVKRVLQFGVENGKLNYYISRIVRTLVNAHKMAEATQPGYPGEQPLSQVYKTVYMPSGIKIFDTGISILQLMMLIAPNELMKELLEYQLQDSLHLLSDILLEQSCFINICYELKEQNQLAKNALELQLINILNLHKNLKSSDLQTTFIGYLFNQSLQEVLQNVSNYNPITQTFNVKSQYENIRESILVKRTQTFFSQLFDKQSSIKNMLKKDNLFEKQIELEKPTICLLITQQATKSQNFFILVQKLANYLWQTTYSSQNYQIIKLMITICIRNRANLEIDRILQSKLSKNPTNQSQKILRKLLSNLVLNQINLSVRISTSLKPVKVNKKRQHFQKLKKQQELFSENNKSLLTEVVENKDAKKQQEQICLICHQAELNGNYPVSIFFHKRCWLIKDHYFGNYFSCNHSFHTQCWDLYNQSTCPVCKASFNMVLTHPRLHQITFLNPQVQNSFSIDSKIAFDSINGFKQELEQNILTKTYFLLLTPYQNFKRESKILRMFYAQLISLISEFQDNSRQSILQTPIIPQIKMIFYLKVLKVLYEISFCKNSLITKRAFQKFIPLAYTKYIAFSFVCYAYDSLNESNYQQEFKQHEQIIKSQMNQFIKGIVYCYNIIFDDKRVAIFDNLKQEDSVSTLFQQYPQFFIIDQQLFEKQVLKGLKTNILKGVSYESLVVTPKTIQVPETLMEFHLKYNNLQCDECKQIVRLKHHDKYLICLHCGYKCCNSDVNEQHSQALGFSLLEKHISKHNGQCLMFNFTTLEIYFFKDNAWFTCDHLYKSKFGGSNQNQNNDWENYKLNSRKWNLILENLRKRTLFLFCMQNSFVWNAGLE